MIPGDLGSGGIYMPIMSKDDGDAAGGARDIFIQSKNRIKF